MIVLYVVLAAIVFNKIEGSNENKICTAACVCSFRK